MDSMSLWEALLLGIVEGITEFLPISSTGHLTILESLLGYDIRDPDITAFTAIIQIGAILATVIYFRKDIVRIGYAWLSGLTDRNQRNTTDYRFGWAIVLGSIPIALIGLLFKDQVETVFRSLWFIAFALLLWSGVMWLAELYGRQNRTERDVTWKDTLIIGVVQCLALIPGVSRSGATMSAGLLRGLDRVTVTKLSFFLSIPALTAAGAYQALTKFDRISDGVGWTATIAASVASFITAYIVIAWLLKYIGKHSFKLFIIYRLLLGTLLFVLLTAGIIG